MEGPGSSHQWAPPGREKGDRAGVGRLRECKNTEFVSELSEPGGRKYNFPFTRVHVRKEGFHCIQRPFTREIWGRAALASLKKFLNT